MPNNTATGPNQTFFLSSRNSSSNQIYAVYGNIYLDPDSERDISFRVEFPDDYSTACILDVECHRCSLYDPADNCDSFVNNHLTALEEVS